MKNIDLSSYGPVIGSKSAGDEIYELLNKELAQNDKISIDLNMIKSMATFCAKQIFGRLYIQLGSDIISSA